MWPRLKTRNQPEVSAPPAGGRETAPGRRGTSPALPPVTRCRPGSCGRLLALFTGILTVYRTWLAGQAPLTADEAYFWQWARHPAWCYHDQPPLLAWVIAATTRLAGNSEPGVRLAGPLFSAGAAWAVYRLGLEISGREKPAAFAAVMVLMTPIFALGGMMATVETPLLFFWCLACLYLRRALVSGRGHAWYAAGAAFGFGLLSKYPALFILPSLALFFAVSPEHRPFLKRREPWLALALALAITAPVIAWNAAHGWVNFTLNFLGRRDFSLGTDLPARVFTHLPEFLAGQAGVITPLLFFFLLWAIIQSARRGLGRGGDTGLRFLFCFSAPVFIFFLLAGCLDRIAPHWPGLTWPAAFIALGMLAERRPRRGRLFGGLFTAAVALTLAMGAAVHLAPLAPGLAFRLERKTPGRTGKIETFYSGWPEKLGRRITATRKDMAAGAAPGQETFILCRGFSLAAYLAFYAPGQPETLAVFQESPQGQSHLFWQRAGDRLGMNAVYVSESHDAPVYFKKIRAAFLSVVPEPELEIRRGDRLVKRFTIWRCYGFLGLYEATPEWAIARSRKQ